MNNGRHTDMKLQVKSSSFVWLFNVQYNIAGPFQWTNTHTCVEQKINLNYGGTPVIILLFFVKMAAVEKVYRVY